jgi:MFS family permease
MGAAPARDKNLRTLYLLIVTQGFSTLGSQMSAYAVGLWLFQRTGSTAYLLLVPFFREFPAMLSASVAGAAVDRWPRKLLMILGDSGQALGSVALLLLIATHTFEVWHLYVIAVWQGTLSNLQGLATDASTALLARKDNLVRVNAVKEMVYPLTGAAAPALAGLLYAVTGIAGVVGFDLLTFLFAVTVVALVPIPDPPRSSAEPEARSGMLREGLVGARYLLRNRQLLWFVLYSSFVCLMINGPLELVIPYTLRITGNQAQVALAASAMNLGAILGPLLLALRGSVRDKVRLFIWGISLNSAMFIIYGVVRTPLALAAALFVLMIPLPATSSLFHSILQSKVPPESQGRVFATISQLDYIASSISFLAIGPLVDRVLEPAVSSPGWSRVAPIVGAHPGAGMGLVLAATGIIMLVVSVLAYCSPGVRQLEAQVADWEGETIVS